MQVTIPKGQPDALPLGPARLVRPSAIELFTFEALLHTGLRSTSSVFQVVPIEAAQLGDVQVLAAREPGKINSPRIDLDRLAEVSSVRSVVASTSVRAGKELPEIRELLFFHGWSPLLPDAGSLGNLPGLESLFSTGAPSDVRLAADRLPGALRDLAIPRHSIKSLADLSRFAELRRLKIQYMSPSDSVEPISELRQLTYLWLDGKGKGWASLGRCVELEEAHLIEVRIANLRRFGAWKRLRRLTVSGRGLQSIEGIDAFEHLETLSLVLLGITDLAPLRGLPRLADVTLRYLKRCHEIGPLGGLPALRRLTIDQSVITDRDICHIDSLKPLAAARNLEEVVLFGTTVDDRDLTPLASLPRLRRVDLDPEIGADVEKLRQARPDIEIRYTPPAETPASQIEKVGEVTIHYPGAGLDHWWIFEDLTEVLGVETNYSAEARVRRAIKATAPDLLKSIDFDTECGGVSISAKTEEEIRNVAEIINSVVSKRR